MFDNNKDKSYIDEVGIYLLVSRTSTYELLEDELVFTVYFNKELSKKIQFN